MALCLVTGQKGYIGQTLYTKLSELGHDVVGIDVKDGPQFDILEGLEKLDKYDVDYVFHLACIPRVAYSVEQPVHTMLNNVISTSIVLDFAKRKNVKRVVYSGSSSVVGNGDGPASPYALQKLTSELETKLYSNLYGIDTVSLRYFNVYSPDQKADSPYATAVANWMRHIEDDGAFKGQNFDVGTGSNISLNEMKDIVNGYFPDVKFDYTDDRPGDVLSTKADMQPLKNLGWSPKIQINDGISDCFAQLKNKLESAA